MRARGPLEFRRIVTSTPLAREHQAMLRRRERRKPVDIPWKRFDRAQYPEGALSIAAEMHRSLAVGEFLAVDSFARVLSGLTMSGAPIDVVAAAARIPADEIRHADHAMRMVASLTASPIEDVRVAVSAAELAERERAYANRPRTLADLDSWMAEVSAFGETIACALLLACANQAREPVTRAYFRAIVADEIHHARLGWYYLVWRSPQWTAGERQRLADRVAAVVSQALDRFGRGRDAPDSLRKATRALGVLDTASQREALFRVMSEEVVPGFDALGLGTSRAWPARPSS